MISVWIFSSAVRTMMMLSLLYLTAASLAQDQQAPALLVSSTMEVPTVHVEVAEVHLSLVVTNRWGHFVRNLQPLDFTIQDNEAQPERITYFENTTDLPLQIALVIDTSDSMNAYLDYEKKSAITFLNEILRTEHDRALVIGFNEDVNLLGGATNNHHSLSAAIRKLRSRGQTAIYDAIWRASQELAALSDVPLSRRAIVVITDGEDNSSHVNPAQAQEMAVGNDSPIYVISTNPVVDKEARASDRAMKELAEATGGTLLQASDGKELQRSFSKVERELRSQYIIVYKQPTGRSDPDGSFHRLVVRGPKSFRIRCRKGYYAR